MLKYKTLSIFLLSFITLVGIFFLATSCYLILFRNSLINITIPRFDIQRYKQGKDNILIIGDSFFDPQWPHIFEWQKKILKKNKINLINVSESNQGPRHHLKALNYYLNNYEFNKVIILFYGGNDLADLYQPLEGVEEGRLSRRGDFFGSQYYILRNVIKKVGQAFQEPPNQEEIIFQGLNFNRDALLVNDLLILKEETISLLEKFIQDFTMFRSKKDFKLGCIFIPASRSIDAKLFPWWQKQKINWDDRLMFNTGPQKLFSEKVSPLCDWFYEDLTSDVRGLIEKGVPMYFTQDPHFDVSQGLKEFLRLLENKILKYHLLKG